MAINSLMVRIKTADRARAGTDNNVYFDVGPLGWELATSSRNDFERGRTDSYVLPLSVSLLESDIVWLRLQKKGLGGVNGLSDGLDGAWLPEWVELWVDGRLFARESVGIWLNVLNDHWVKQVQFVGASPAEVFARTLRMKPNDPISPFDETSAFVATGFKKLGISGWRPTAVGQASAIGRTIRPVPLSTDGLATIDLEVEAISSAGEFFRVDSSEAIRGPRFLRVEYLARTATWPMAGGVYSLPAQGERVRIAGTVKWDTDREWWYEIHTDNPRDVELSLPPRPKLSLRVSYPPPSVVNKDERTYHWGGMSSVPREFEPVCKARDFTYLALQYTDHPRVELVSSTPVNEVKWFVEDRRVQPGTDSVSVMPSGSHLSSLPPFAGTPLSNPVEIAYNLAGDVLELRNDPKDGNYSVQVRLQADATGPVSAQAWVTVQGDAFIMDASYAKISEQCRAAVVLARGNYRTTPLPIPQYDPYEWAKVNMDRLHGIWDALQRAVFQMHRTQLTVEETDAVSLTRQIQAILVAYPEAAQAVAQLLPKGVARHIRVGPEPP